LVSCGYGIYHKVQKGETIQQIAKKYNVPEKEIINANKKGPLTLIRKKSKREILSGFLLIKPPPR